MSSHTAGLMITNREDTGIYNLQIAEFVRVVHEAGGLCAYAQANANGILGITQARGAMTWRAYRKKVEATRGKTDGSEHGM